MNQRLDHQALSPDGMRALGGVHHYISSKSGLPSALVNLVYLRVSQINGCAFCISSHTSDLLKGGMAVHKLMMLTAWRETPDLFDEKERAALQWAEAVTLVAQTAVPDAEYEAAALHFAPKEIVDLTLAVGLINVYNRLAISFRRTPESLGAN